MKTLFLVLVLAFSTFAQSKTFHGQNSWQSGYAFAWESSLGVTGNPVSDWRSFMGGITLTQGTAGNRPTVTASAFGTYSGFTFDGTNDALSYAGQAVARTGAASLNIVFKTPATITGPVVLVSQADSAVANDWWEIGIDSDARIYVSRNASGTIHKVKGANFLAASTIYDVLLTYDGTDFYMQLNGVEENPLTIESQGSYAWLGAVGGTRVFSVGATVLSTGATRFFNGSIGAVYFWNRDITQ